MPLLPLALVAEMAAADVVRHLRAVRTADPPRIDGRVDDGAWQAAAVTSAFTQRSPVDGEAPTERTVMRVLYDDDNVYVAFECDQAGAPVVARLTRRDRVVEGDHVSVALGTRGDRKSAFEFTVSAAGVLLDKLRFDDTEEAADWDENWEGKAARTEGGWSAELRIPLRTLRFVSRTEQSWDLQATRYISEKQETDVWAYSPRTAAGEVSRYGHLDGLSGLHAGTPFELRPFVLGRLRHRAPGVGEVASGTDFAASAGADLKWHPTQDLTLDVTLNPDFAQVEADQLVLNLTTFETFYPEKRPFFLEGTDVFATPAQLVYTRRIGRAPATPTLRGDVALDEHLVDVPEPTAIYGAAKLTGRVAPGWTVGTLQAVTARNLVTVQVSGHGREPRLVDPTSSYSAVRVKRALGDGSDIGLLATAVTHAEATASDYPPTEAGAGPQQLCPNGTVAPRPSRCFNNAYVGGLDWRWRSADGDYSAGAQAATSVLDKGPPRSVPDGTVIRPGEPGVGAVVTVNKDGGVHWVTKAHGFFATPKLDYNDLGFMQRSNVYGAGVAAEYRRLSPFGPFLEAKVHLDVGFEQNLAGVAVDNFGYLGSSGKLRNFWVYYVDVHGAFRRFDDREVGDGTALERAARVGGEVSIETDPTRAFVVSFEQLAEAPRGAVNLTGNAKATIHVLPQLDVEGAPTWTYTAGEPRYATSGAAPLQSIFGKLDARSFGVTLRSTYTFTPRLSLQAYGQLFLTSGHYRGLTQFTAPAGKTGALVHLSDLTPFAGSPPSNPDFEQGVVNVNVVLRWEYALGSTLYLVYQRAQVPTTTLGPSGVGELSLGAIGRSPVADVALVKLSYFWGD